MNDNLIVTDARPKRADAVENRALLLQTAQRLFDEQGVERVTMSAVAEAAGVGKGTLYRHFTNKNELCLALLDEDQRDLQARTFTYLNAPGNPAEQLRWFVGEAFAFVSRNMPLLQGDSGECSHLGHPAHLWWRLTIRGLLARMDSELDSDYAADILYVMLDPRTIAYQRNTLAYDHDRIVSGLWMTVDQLLNV